VEKAGLSSLNEGAKVSYEEMEKPGQDVCGKSKDRLEALIQGEPAGSYPAGISLHDFF
jgi:hypothetical protein